MQRRPLFQLEFKALFPILKPVFLKSVHHFRIAGPVQSKVAVTTKRKIPAKEKTSSGTINRRTYDADHVRTLFDGIAPRYDFLNHLLSSGIDVFWRKKAISLLKEQRPSKILDVATGTGDLAFEACRLHPQSIVGIDFATAMLDLARLKAGRKGLSSLVSFTKGQAEKLPFDRDTFDAVTVAFGVRNFSNLEKGLSEMVRVIRPGGAMVVLEFSKPRSPFIAGLYGFYSKRILPMVGGYLSSKEAYEYLPSTIQEFPDGDQFAKVLEQAGLQHIRTFPLTFGIVTIYHGIKGGRSNRAKRD